MFVPVSGKFMKTRTASGTVIAEFVPATIMLVLVAMIAANLGLALFGAWVNDSACRDAVRAAAQQGTSATALAAAKVAVQSYHSGSWFNGPTIVEDKDAFQYQTFPDKNGKPQRAQGPYVTITTTLQVKLPAKIAYHDAKMTDHIDLRQAYTFPIMNPQNVAP
jgi:hypothetical protein